MFAKIVPCTRLKGVGDTKSTDEPNNEQGMTPLFTKSSQPTQGGERERENAWAQETITRDKKEPLFLDIFICDREA